MNKDAYKELRKKLKNKFKKDQGDYGLPSAIFTWMEQCGIEPNQNKLLIVGKIMGSAPYPHQEKDRLIIIKYLKGNKYKQFKKDFK